MLLARTRPMPPRLARATPRSLAAPLAALTLLLGCHRRSEPATSTPEWLLEGARLQSVSASSIHAFRGFGFVDRRAESRITFVDQIVEDAGKAYKPVHYDHGTGLAAADVDGDGRPDLYFVSQRGTSELWRNVGGGRFENVTAAAGLTMHDAIAVGASFADIDNDGDPDLFVTTVRHGNRLYENAGGGKFRDITAQAGVGYVGHSSGAVFFDYDGDGRLDLFVANVGRYTTDVKGPGDYYVGLTDAFHGHTHPDRAEASVLYHNLGGNRFEDVTQKTGLVDLSWSGDATPIDANGDGRLDLYVLDMQGENHLWLNEGGTHFRDATAQYFPRTPWGAMGAKVFDVNGDGRLDLYVTDMHSDMFGDIAPGEWLAEGQKSDAQAIPDEYLPTGRDHLVFGNAMFVRGAPGDSAPFREASRTVGGETYWPWGPSVDDVNADGWDDAFVTAGMSFPFRYGVNSLLINEGGHALVRSEFVLGVEPRRGAIDQDWFTLDCAGADRGHRSCGICTPKDSTGLPAGCKGDPRGRLTVTGTRSSRSAVLVDIDGDGDLDIVTNEFNAMPQVLISNLAGHRTVRRLQVRLQGTRSNREGLGATVTVVLPDGRRLVKVMDGRSGYLSQSALPLYFGLGDAAQANAVEVQWPSGTRQTVAGPIASGTMVDIAER